MAKPVVPISGLTSSKTGTFYFAFGSNLSVHQMSLRLPHHRTSSVPVAIARLDRHDWIICQRGYANVVALPESHQAAETSTVWGVVYNMSPEDEAVLDRYEGHDSSRNPTPEVNADPETRHIKPFHQGSWDYNKHYLPMTVTKWLRDPHEYGVSVPHYGNPATDDPAAHATIRALVYIDEFRTQPGRINWEYIGRMNRAIMEGVALGLPEAWVEAVMRPFIPAGIFVDHDGYVGTNQGYAEAETTEVWDSTKEKEIEEWRQRHGGVWRE